MGYIQTRKHLILNRVSTWPYISSGQNKESYLKKQWIFDIDGCPKLCRLSYSYRFRCHTQDGKNWSCDRVICIITVVTEQACGFRLLLPENPPCFKKPQIKCP